MSNEIFDQFDELYLNNDLLSEIEKSESGEGGGDYKEVPLGKYEVKIHKMELNKSKKGDPMFVCWFKIIAGDYSGSMIFMNQILTKGFQVHIINEFLRSLKSKHDIMFVSYKQYSQLIYDVMKDITGKWEYGLDYSEVKGFKQFKVFSSFESTNNEETPF